MNGSPPADKPVAKRRTPRRLWIVAAVVLVTMMLIAVGLAARLPDMVQAYAATGQQQAHAGPFVMLADDAAEPAALPGNELPAGRQASDFVMLREGDRALEGEPAELPEFPGGKRLAGFMRSEGGMIEQQAAWQLPATADAAAAFYYDAALERGFQALGGASPNLNLNGESITSVFIRPAPSPRQSAAAGEVLVVRVTSLAPAHAEPAAQVVLWLQSAADAP